ncbi:MAG: hypothetical protein R3236_06530, partial [Phycisphaeraceae bacterium]|nr:hypothetical protein [Phycisphaeraceae bacterium]
NLLGFTVTPSQLQVANPVLILTLIPLFSYGLLPLASRFFRVTPMGKVTTGFVLAATSFAVAALIESRIQDGHAPSVAWQLLAYVFLTAGEVLVSVTCLEYAYTQSPKSMKSFIMSIFLASVAVGNLWTALVIKFGANTLQGARYYWFFTGTMLVTTIAFAFVSRFYKEADYIIDEAHVAPPPNE